MPCYVRVERATAALGIREGRGQGNFGKVINNFLILFNTRVCRVLL